METFNSILKEIWDSSSVHVLKVSHTKSPSTTPFGWMTWNVLELMAKLISCMHLQITDICPVYIQGKGLSYYCTI